jgi:hypothetical protein
MRIRRRPSPLFLLLIPSLASVVIGGAVDSASSDLVKSNEARDAKAVPPVAASVGTPEVASVSSKTEVGTKDAPVDGLDGKPHAGPFVDPAKDKLPSKVTEDGELAIKKPPLKGAPADPTLVDGKQIPQKLDGVMNDPTRELPKKGTTGIEGGVSEKDAYRKTLESQTGGKVEMLPVAPNEAPPLPHSEEKKIQTEKEKTDKKTGKDKVDDVSDLAGFEV